MKNKISIITASIIVFTLVFVVFNVVKAVENEDNGNGLEIENKLETTLSNQVEDSVKVDVGVNGEIKDDDSDHEGVENDDSDQDELNDELDDDSDQDELDDESDQDELDDESDQDELDLSL